MLGVSQTLSTSVHFGADHPAFAGHFPGNPLVPGVVILDAVIEAVGMAWPDLAIGAVSSAKFLTPVRPGQEIAITATRSADGVRFSCAYQGRVVAQGLLGPAGP